MAEVGAGIAVEPDGGAGDATVASLREAIETVLAEASYRERARSLADELRAQPPVDEAVPLFGRLEPS